MNLAEIMAGMQDAELRRKIMGAAQQGQIAGTFDTLPNLSRRNPPAQNIEDPWTRSIMADLLVGMTPGAGTIMAGNDAAVFGKGVTEALAEGRYPAAAGNALLSGLSGLDAMLGGVLPIGAGIKLFHGSPHKFDTFDMSKIGTGEGAQAYGHGLYFAENPEVAGAYQAQLSGPFGNAQNTRSILDALPDRLRSQDNARKLLTQIDDAINSGDIKSASQYVDAFNVTDELVPAYRAAIDVFQDKGRLYTVDIPDESIERMLDWDAPLSEQPKAIKEKLVNSDAGQKLKREYAEFNAGFSMEKNEWLGVSTGRDLYRAMGGDQVRASAALNELGIPGIKYYDGGSRAAGSGTRNFVVFDDTLPKIRSRE